MRIGYDGNSGHVYEGANLAEYPVVPPPLLTLARLIEVPEDFVQNPRGIHQDPFSWVFREDSFDPVTRIRRGRLYEPVPSGQPAVCLTRGHPADQFSTLRGQGLSKSLYTYWPCQALIGKPRGGEGLMLGLGQGSSWSLWKIVQVERLLNDDVLVTLKALAAFGILPDIKEDAIPADSRASVQRAVDRVLDAAFRESSISVIDHCRNAVTVLLSRWLASNHSDDSVLRLDLSALVKRVQDPPHRLVAAASAAEMIRLLHPRGKANVQETSGYRLAQEEDAEAAVHAVGFILREINWAR